MPIPAPGVFTPPPPPPPPPPVEERPPEIPPDPSWLSPSVVLESSAGDRMRLQGTSGVVLQSGMRGVGLAPVDLVTEPLPDRDGSVVMSLRLTESEVFLPVVILSSRSVDLRERRRDLERLLDPKCGMVKIQITQPDSGEKRHIFGYYKDGMRGAYGRDESGHNWQRLGLVFQCPDPWWYGDTITPPDFTVQAGTKPFLSPTVDFFPIILGSSTVAGRVNLTNPGEDVAWPVWTITGPAPSGLTLTNNTTGKTFELTTTIAGGDTVTIDSRRGVQDVYDENGNDLWDDVELGTYPWPLVQGVNEVTVTVASATSATKVHVEYDPPYRSGH